MPKVSVSLGSGGKPIATTEKPTPVVPVPAEAMKGKAETLALVPTFNAQITMLNVTSADSYDAADLIFGRIKAARKAWGGRMEGIIRPIRQGLDALYALNREVDGPLAKAEAAIEGKMKAFKLHELNERREAERAQEEERRKLDEKARKLVAPAAQARVATQLAELDAQTFDVVQGQHSASRPMQKIRLKEDGLRHLLQGIISGEVPEDCIFLNQPALNRYYKEDAATVKAWPGLEEYDDIQIVGRP